MSEGAITRRAFLKKTGAALAGASVFSSVPHFWVKAQSRPLQVAVYGGIFKEVLDDVLFAPFRRDTGIAVESRPAPTGPEMYAQIRTAVQQGQAPVDVAILASSWAIRGARERMWFPLPEHTLPNIQHVPDTLRRYSDDGLVSVAALAWYINLVYNEMFIREAPTGWADLWNPAYSGQLGLLAHANNSFLLDITAHTFFGGPEVLQTQDGVMEVMSKLAEVRPHVRMWYLNEATFQAALVSGEVPMGQLYNDVTQVLVDEGAPVVSVFPKEGPVMDRGEWVILKTSPLLAAAEEFVNYACRPDVQERITTNLYTIPTVREDLINVSDDIRRRVIGPGAERSIVPQYHIYMDWEEWINERWQELIVTSAVD
ncbi:MAG: extracellular solute-binding protein [Firmicutes bacterium]|nr:extracellular solute-binding protein [Bacillota bacterium]